MNSGEILRTLKEATNFELRHNGDIWTGYGAIDRCPECTGMTSWEYSKHYDAKKTRLENLPWTKEVKNPRRPEPGEYPEKDGEYITMLDCDEHCVLCNEFRDGKWALYNRTHVKWWMEIPENEKKTK